MKAAIHVGMEFEKGQFTWNYLEYFFLIVYREGCLIHSLDTWVFPFLPKRP